MLKKWWVRGLLGSAVWAVLTIGAGILHTSVILGGRLSEAEDAAISERYGQACGGGVLAILLICYLIRNRKPGP